MRLAKTFKKKDNIEKELTEVSEVTETEEGKEIKQKNVKKEKPMKERVKKEKTKKEKVKKEKPKKEKQGGNIKVSAFLKGVGKITKPLNNIKIFYKLIFAFLVPIVMMVALGILSYNTAAKNSMNKFEESAGSTVTSVAEYFNLLSSNVETNATELLVSAEVKDYFGLNASSSDQNKEASSYSNMKTAVLKSTSSTKYVANVHAFAAIGRPVSSTTKESLRKVAFEETAYDDFQKQEGAPFTDTKFKEMWIGSHPYIDAATGLTSSDYAISFVKRFVTGKGFLIIDIKDETVEEILGEVDFGKGSYISLVTSDGKEINMQSGERVDEVVYTGKEFYEKSLNTEENCSGYISMNHKKYLYLYAPIGETGMRICALIPQASIIGEVAEVRNTTILFVIVASIVAIAIGTILSASIRITLEKISKSMKIAAEGDLTVSLTTKRGDEFGHVSNSIAKMIAGMRELLAKVQSFSGMVGNSAEQVSDTTGQILSSMQEVNTAIGEVENDVVRQADDADKGYQMMIAFGEKINNISETADTMGGMADNTIGSVEKGTRMVDELKKTATATTEITQVLVDNVADVSAQSGNIKTIIDTINDIAEETNLLSLNASIEAARAGDSGRGFAVVAQSIGKLAEQSMKAGNEIKKIIGVIETTTATAKESAVQTEENVKFQMEALEETVTVFHEIHSYVQELVDRLEKITGEMESLVRDKDEVLGTIRSVSVTSESASAATVEVTASIAEQVGFLSALTKDAEHLKEQAQMLDDAMQQFTI